MAVKDYNNRNVVLKEIANMMGPLTEKEQEVLSEHLIVRKFKKNELIYRDSESPAQLMFLLFGKVKVYKDGISGKNQILRVVKPIEVFAYRAYFAGEEYRTAGMALEPSTVAFIDMKLVIEMMKENYNVSFFFIRRLAKELGASDERTVNLTQKHLRGRLAEALIFLEDTYGVEQDGYTLSIYLSREDLADLSNMTTSNAIRTLSSFANEKLIAIDGRKIKIIEDAELRKVSEMG